jgi:hypothetical protein
LVTDKNGAAVTGATITVVKTATNESRQTKTDSGGRYVIPFVQPGNYTITADAKGFNSSKEENVLVQVTETRPVDFQLAVGSVTQSVEVIATADVLDTDTSTLGQTIQSSEMLQLPDINRNIFDFAMLVPGVNNTGGASTPHIGGARNGNNEQLIDGMTNILPENNVGNNESAYQPVEDSIQEVNVQTSVLPAEYGRFSGGTISLITKSGSNKFHGSYFEFIQEGSLDATPFGAIGQPRTGPKPDMHLYDSGGTVGGPILRDRAFFFFDYEKIDNAGGGFGQYHVPDPAVYGGDFTSLFGSTTPVLFDPDTVAKDPTTGVYVRQPFVTNGEYNVIPANRISPVMQKLIAYFPKPNLTPTTADGNNYQTTQSIPSGSWHFDTREDVDVTKNWHSFLRYSMLHQTSTVLNDYNNAASPGGYGGAGHGYDYSGAFDNTFTISASLLAELRYGYSKATFNRIPVGGTFDLAAAGFDSGFIGYAQAQQFPWFNFNGGTNNGNYSDLGPQGYETYQEDPLAQSINGSLIKILGGHTIKVGGEFRALRLNFYQWSVPTGQYGVSDSWTRQLPQTEDGATGYSVASFLMGLPDSGYMTHDTALINSSQYVGFYGQDDWKASSKLTINLGLRYDFEVPRVDQNNNLSFWDPTVPSPLQAAVPSGELAANLKTNGETCPSCGNLMGAMTLVGTPGAKYGRRQGPTEKTDFAPRLGMAYNATPKVVVRAGAGIVFAPSGMQAAGPSGDAGVDGFSTQTNMNTSFTNQDALPAASFYSPDPALANNANVPYPTGFAQPQAASSTCLSSTACVQGIDLGNAVNADYFDSYRNPYTIQWNGSVQFAAPWGMKVEVGYLGNRGLFLIQGDPGVPHDQLSPGTLIANGCNVGASTGQCALSATVNNPFASVLAPGTPFYTPGQKLSGAQTTGAQLQHLYPQYTDVHSVRKPDAASIAHLYTLRADKAMSHGLTFTFSLTREIEHDNGASAVSYLGNTSQTYANQYNPKGEWSIGAQDLPYDIAGSFVYQLPFGHGRDFFSGDNIVADKLINGWQISGIEGWTTGTPIVLSSVDNGTTAETLGNGFSQRPDWNLSNPKLTSPSYKLWFNKSAYSVPLAYEIGNAPRTLGVNSPSQQNLDLQLAKDTGFGPSERYVVQLRFEAFNAFNHGSWSGPDTNVTDGNFGVISGFSTTARRFQFAAKFSF